MTEGTGDEQTERTPEALQESQQLDEDTIDVDPLEAGWEPPDDWAEADAYGTTPAEQRAGDSHEERLREERGDVGT